VSASSHHRVRRSWRDYEAMFGDRRTSSFHYGGMFIGAIAALLIVIPFVGATFLERSAGDAITVAILVAVALVALAGAALLLMRRFLILGLLLAHLAVWCGVAVYITLRMDW